jgi:LPXTG-motif cell wall-anchored protein
MCAVAVVLAASLAIAQNADPNTGGPTKNDLRLRLTEPTAGQSITGSTIRVAVDYNRQIFSQGDGTKFGERNYPQPRFDVYLDNQLKETLKGGENNVATINDVPAGSHTITVVAKNVSNEIIDRQEVKVTNTTAVASTETSGSAMGTSGSTSATTESTSGTTATSEPSYAKGPSTSMPSTETTSSGSTASTTNESTAPSTTTSESTLPKTASHAPLAGVLGLGLVAAGLLVARKAR